MEPFTGLPLGIILTQYGPVGLCVLAVLAGWLIPRWVLSELRKDRDKWREAYFKSEDTKAVLANHLSAVLHEYGPTANQALNAIPRAGGDANVVQENTQPGSPRR